MAQAPDKVVIGIDVGSTTVKMTVVDPATKEILWSKYLRHETRQPEITREMLREIHAAFPTLTSDKIRTFITGSGGGPIAPHLGAKFVQEVNAVTMAVEKLHPDVGSVIEASAARTPRSSCSRRTSSRRVGLGDARLQKPSMTIAARANAGKKARHSGHEQQWHQDAAVAEERPR